MSKRRQEIIDRALKLFNEKGFHDVSIKQIADSLSIRRTALSKKIPYFTTISAAKIAITGLNIVNNSEISVKSIQELYNL